MNLDLRLAGAGELSSLLVGRGAVGGGAGDQRGGGGGELRGVGKEISIT